jgi:eukaryotic-like serine/threonine-protein kinase
MEEVARTTGVKEGDVLAGKYRIEKVLGMGGMGVVVAARHLQLETKVAIKFLLPEMLKERELVARFAREARAAVKITGEHVARVLDVGTLETGAPFIVMEFLEGSDLHAWLQQRGALAVDQAVEFLLQACVAVAEAHALGIVHRDLKPANLFCIRRADGKPSIKVLDFGISKVAGGSASEGEMSVTKTNAMMGSPLYMSPEQMRSAKDADPQSDVWALGAILYELLTGRVPFDGETVTDVAIKVATQPTPSARALRADVPPGLEEIVFKALEKNRQDRYRSVAELAIALSPFAPARGRPLVDRICGILQVGGWTSLAPPDAAPPAPAPPRAAAVTMSAVGRTTMGLNGGRRRNVAIALSSAGAAAVAGLAFALLHSSPLRRQATTSAMVQSVATAPVSTAALSTPTAADMRLPPVGAEATDAGLSLGTAVQSPSATPQASSPKRVGAHAAQARPGQPPLIPRAAPPAPVAATPPTPASPPPPPSVAPRKNQLDLGNFQ